MDRRITRRAGSWLAALVLSVGLAACGGNSGGSLAPLPQVPGAGTGDTGSGGGTGTGTGTGGTGTSGTGTGGTGSGTGTGGTGSGTGTGTGTGGTGSTDTGGTGTGGTGGTGTGGTGSGGTGSEATTGPARIVQIPSEIRVPRGQRGTITVVAAGAAPLQYVWFNNIGDVIRGESGSSLTIGPVEDSDSGKTYRVQLTNALTSQPVISSPVTLVVIPPLPTIEAGPRPVWVVAGQEVTQTVTATSPTPVTCYQWLRNGVPIPGATTTSYTQTLQLTDNNTQLSVRVCNESGSSTSESALIRVSATAVAPTITRNPLPVTVRAGQDAEFIVEASGTEPMKYEWFYNGNKLTELSPGFAIPVLWTIQNNQLSYDGWQVTVRVSNPAGSATSQPVRLTVLP